MNESPLWIQPLEACEAKSLVGMKAVNLGRLIRAGFPVPGGFVVTTHAFRATLESRPSIEQAICAAYRAIGSPSVAVRSSATAEDMAGASMAGQYDTFLDITNETSLLKAVRDCWTSIDSPRTRTYFLEHGIELSQVAMAVVVQKLIPADVAGVMFTANPQSGARREMLIEASWGLGEAVVSGRVQPDLLRLDRQTGRVIDSRIADKLIHIAPGAHEERPVEEHRRRTACLRSGDVAHLWRLGRKAAAHFEGEQDLEWAISGGEPYLLQSRPITTLEEAEAVEHLLQATRAELRAESVDGLGPWVVHNLGETLPHPTMLTWSVMRRFMSGAGGFGAMYRAAGFEPSPTACADGFLKRIAGRVYMDLARAPEMFFENYPFTYDPALLRDSPDAANAPPTIPTGSARDRLSAMRRVGAAGARLQRMASTLHQRLRDVTIPEFVSWCQQEQKASIDTLTTDELIALWRSRQKRVLDEFAPQSLLPSLISGMAMLQLQTFLAEHFWNGDSQKLAELLASAREPDKTLQANTALYEVAREKRTLDAWIAEFGHRAPDELDLATPRWRERPNDLLPLAKLLRDGANPAERHHEHQVKVRQRELSLRKELNPAQLREFDQHLELARQYLVYREDGKYFLTLGYALLRDVALEMARRLEVADGVFHLTEEELFDALRVGFAPLHLIEQRQLEYKAESRVRLPQILDTDGLEKLGEPPAVVSGNGTHSAYALSAGLASGPVRIVHSPEAAGDLGHGYVLVCPSTDPAWTPLFVNAAALVLECGGALSHGAVVAREMGIPAVVLPQATSLLPDGEVVTVDGHRGAVAMGALTETTGDVPLSNSVEPADVPPPRGNFERSSVKLAIVSLVFWSLYLAAAFLLPERVVYQPSMRALDAALWPLVAKLGRPTGVAAIAVAMAAITMFGQRFLTDNERLLEAKRRSARLHTKAAALPAESPLRAAMLALAGPTQGRIFIAALIPLALFLGPMVMIFGWFPSRVDPASWNAPVGSPMSVIASVDGDYQGSLSLETSPALVVDPTTPANNVSLPPIRATLDKVRKSWAQPSDLSTQPWELQHIAEAVHTQQLAALDDYLNHPIPAQNVVWKLQPVGNDSARFPIAVRTPEQTVSLEATLGDVRAPSAIDVQTSSGPIRSIKIEYVKIAAKQVFWIPFASALNWMEAGKLPKHGSYTLRGWDKVLRGWDVGWLLTYLVAYLPAMYLCRRVLRIA